MHIETLEDYLTICNSTTLVQAAKKMNISQPALSKMLKTIEQYYGAELFDRVGKKLILNKNGKLLQEYAKAIIDSNNEIRRKFYLENDGIKHFKLAYNDTDVMPRLITNFAATHSDIAMELFPIDNNSFSSRKMVDSLLTKDYDAAILTYDLQDEGIHRLHLFRNYLFVAIPKGIPIDKKKKYYIRDFDNTKFLRKDRVHSDYVSRINDLLYKEKIHLNVMFYVEKQLASSLVENTDCYSFVSSMTLNSKNGREILNRHNIVKLNDPELMQDVFLYYTDKHNSNLDSYRNWLIQNYMHIYGNEFNE